MPCSNICCTLALCQSGYATYFCNWMWFLKLVDSSRRAQGIKCHNNNKRSSSTCPPSSPSLNTDLAQDVVFWFLFPNAMVLDRITCGKASAGTFKCMDANYTSKTLFLRSRFSVHITQRLLFTSFLSVKEGTVQSRGAWALVPGCRDLHPSSALVSMVVYSELHQDIDMFAHHCVPSC